MWKQKPLSLDKLQGELTQAQSLKNLKCNNIFTMKLRKKEDEHQVKYLVRKRKNTEFIMV